jgi:hypothetical protein
MGRSVRNAAGGITSLCRFVEEHAGAIQFDLITFAGYRIRDIGEVLSWTELRDFVNNLPPTPASALFRAEHPKSWWWTPEADFLSAILFGIQLANWQRAGGKRSKPKPVQRPNDPPTNKYGPKTGDELAARRKQLRDSKTRREAQ